MVSSVGITDTIKTLSDLQTRCNLRQSNQDNFFCEWVEKGRETQPLPELKDTPEYDVSRTFSLFPRQHELAEVLRILKRLGQAVLA
jgi:hypothetical protein